MRHPDAVRGPNQPKEVRFWTPGIKQKERALSNDSRHDEPGGGREIGPRTSLRRYSDAFAGAVPALRSQPETAFTGNANPHTLWYPPGAGSNDVPTPQAMHLVNPQV